MANFLKLASKTLVFKAIIAQNLDSGKHIAQIQPKFVTVHIKFGQNKILRF